MNVKRLIAAITMAFVTAACGAGSRTTLSSPTDQAPSTGTASPGTPSEGASAATPAAQGTAGRTERVDPREGGLDVGMGEWAVTPEASAIRPGEVTFLIANHGTLVHGFEIEREDGPDDGDNSGSGSQGDDGFKVESRLLQPGETLRLTVDLVPGLYKVECKVDGHDDLGMETMLEVREDAPLVSRGSADGAPEVSIEGFVFSPATITVGAGTEVTWTNADLTEHTVTAEDGSFGSDPFTGGATFSTTFDRPGTFAYICAIHPEMKGAVEVTAG